MSAAPIRLRPLKLFRVLIAYGPYRVGDTIQPTGVYRDALKARRIIEEVPETPPAALFQPPLELDDEPDDAAAFAKPARMKR